MRTGAARARDGAVATRTGAAVQKLDARRAAGRNATTEELIKAIIWVQVRRIGDGWERRGYGMRGREKEKRGEGSEGIGS